MAVAVVVMVVLSVAHTALGYPSADFSNSFTGACDNMAPSHGVSAQAAQSSPFILEVPATSYTLGGEIMLTLRSTDGMTTFRGFMIQARRVSTGERVGEFTNLATSMKQNCGGKAVTHNSRSEKDYLQPKWLAPDADLGEIEFWYTVVRTETLFWQALKSSAITGPQPTVDLDAIDFSQCGVTRSCFRSPALCTTECDFGVSWLSSVDAVDIRLQATVSPADRKYVALGFSTDELMGADSVVDCNFAEDIVDIGSSYNVERGENADLQDRGLGLRTADSQGVLKDGNMICQFTRLLSVMGDESDQVFDLSSQSYYLLLAKGQVDGMGAKVNHGPTTRTASVITFDLTSDQFVDEHALTPPSDVLSIDLDECEATKSCYRVPANCAPSDCDFIATWQKTSDTNVMIELEGPAQSGSPYLALGLSMDTNMGTDSVMDCRHLGDGSYAVRQSYNSGRSNADLTDSLLGLETDTQEVGVNNGVMTCRFTRLISVSSTGPARRKRATGDEEKIFDLNEMFYLLTARGSVSGGEKQPHAWRERSSAQYHLASDEFVNAGGAAGTSSLVKVHAILMIFAWMVFASWAILMPRYCKTAWPGKKCGGKDIWFQIHMPLMILTFFLTAIGFIIIFVHAKGYSDFPDSVSKAHPPLGIIVTILVIINPIMAACRPHPGTSRRPLFNGLHFTVGLLAHLCSVAAIFIAVYKEFAGAPSWGKWIMVVYIVWHTFIEISLAIVGCRQKDSPKSKYEMGPTASGNMAPQESIDPDRKISSGKTFLVGMHLLGVVALSLALIIPIGQS